MVGTIYVTTEDGTLVDALELEEFILGNPSDHIHQIMDHLFVTLSPEDDREEAVRKIQKYDLYAIPVIDEQHHLVGAITAEEITEDFHKGASDIYSYASDVGDSQRLGS